MTNDQNDPRINNPFGEPSFFEPDFRNPREGIFRNMPEEWWKGKAVRFFTPVEIDGKEMLAPIWVDFVEFRDVVVDGVPCRIGIGRVQQRVTDGVIGELVQRHVVVDKALDAGVEVEFDPAEVFDVIERMSLPAGGIGGWLATA